MTRSPIRRPALPGLLALIVALTALVPAGVLGAGPASAAARTVIDDGHIDLGPRIVDGGWAFQLRDDTVSPHVWRSLDDVALAVGDDVEIEVPDDDAYAFLGEPGEPSWVLPQVQRSGVVWPGWNTQDPGVVDAVRGEVTFTVVDVDGPGEFTLFLSGAFGAPDVVFDGAKAWPQSTQVAPNVHAHGNWAFSAPGLYRLRLRMAATGADGPLTDTRTLVLAVGAAARAQIQAAGTGDAGDAGGQGDGQDALAQAGGELPNTGPGRLSVVAGGAAALLVLGLVLTVRQRRTRGARSGARR